MFSLLQIGKEEIIFLDLDKDPEQSQNLIDIVPSTKAYPSLKMMNIHPLFLRNSVNTQQTHKQTNKQTNK